jgi:ubiquinone biosynthesis protein
MSQIVPAGESSRSTGNAIVRGAHLIKDASRLRDIVAVAARHGFGEVIERLNFQDNALLAILARSREGERVHAKTTPERVRAALQELGPTFVKMGQVLSTRPDIVPAEYLEQLRHLQDDVEPVPFEEVRATIEAATGRPLPDAFAEIDPTPVAAASVAQVHRGRLYDGEEVAIKVLRPAVRDVVRADIGVMDLLARRLEATFAEARALNIVAMVREFERAMRRELDLRTEARNLKRFRAMFEGRTDVRVPAVISELSSRDVLVMEFVHGERITDAAEKMDAGHREALVRTCFDVLFTMVLREGVFHGDLHPGNVKITADGAVAIYDFGMVGRLSQQMRDRLVDLLVALGQRDDQAVADSFHDMAQRTRPVNMREFSGDVAELLDGAFADRTVSELELGAVLAQLGEIGARHGMRVPAEYAMMIKAALTVEGMGKTLAPEVDPLEIVRPYVTEALRVRYSPDRLGTEAARTLISVSRVVRELPPTIQEMLRAVEGGRARFGVDLTPSRDLGPLLRKALSPMNDAVLAGTFAIAGALALPHGPEVLLGMPAPSALLFALSIGFLGRALFRNRSKK